VVRQEAGGVMGKLTLQKIAKLIEPGRYGDGNGLYLKITPTGNRSWLFRYERKGRERVMGLGPLRICTLSRAREKARAAEQQLADGIDPIDARRLTITADAPPTIPDKWQAFAAQGIEPTCFLYRHYDASGDLLYVGMSLSVLARQARHIEYATWGNTICQIVIEPFATREELLAAEKYAIRTEFPKHNFTHNGRLHVLQEAGAP
jgi:Arm DNA-binding domain